MFVGIIEIAVKLTEGTTLFGEVLKVNLVLDALAIITSHGPDVALDVALNGSRLEEGVHGEGRLVGHADGVVVDGEGVGRSLAKDLADQGGRENGESCCGLHLEIGRVG